MSQPRCFMAMPVSTKSEEAERYGGDDEHWRHVMESLFIPAIADAGFEPVIPVATGASLIHADIIRHLEVTDLVLCDLSSHNPNVFFELGVRTSLDKPIALVKDEHTTLPFDTAGINTHTYSSALRAWDLEAARKALAEHITSSAETCNGRNPLWRQFGLTMRAQEANVSENPLEAKVDLLMGEVARLRDERLAGGVRRIRPRLDEASLYETHSRPVAELVRTVAVNMPDVNYQVLDYGPSHLRLGLIPPHAMTDVEKASLRNRAKKVGVELDLVEQPF